MNTVVQEKPKQEVAKRNPAQELRLALDKMKPEFTYVLPQGVSPDRFVRTIMTAVQADNNLLDANRKTLFAAAMHAAQDGLLPDGRQGAFVLYKRDVQWMPMIRGIIQKAREGGDIATLSARVVYENDRFEYVLGDDERIVHEPTMKQRGKLVACYAIAKMKDGEVEREVMTAEDVDAVRGISRAKNGPWAGPFEAEMWRKTVLRRLLKRLPMTPILEQIINRDEDHYEFKDHHGVTWRKRDAKAALDGFASEEGLPAEPVAEEPQAEDADYSEEDYAPEQSAGEEMEAAVKRTTDALAAVEDLANLKALDTWVNTAWPSIKGTLNDAQANRVNARIIARRKELGGK